MSTATPVSVSLHFPSLDAATRARLAARGIDPEASHRELRDGLTERRLRDE